MAGLLSRYFGFRERSTDLGTEVRAGFTTFMVMAYIIFVNPVILGFTGVPGLDGKGLPFAATLTVTCLAAGLLSIAMGLASNYPFALAAGIGLNAVVAFDLVAGRGLTWPQAMTVIFLEGAIITVLVLTRFREALMDAVPVGLKRAISVGIGLFIAFIGFFTSGLVIKPAPGPLPVGLGTFRGLPITVFLIGFVLTAWLMARRTRGALLLGILGTTVVAIALNEAVAVLVMPFTWSITNGIGAGFVTYTAIKLLRGRGGELSWMIYLACAAFVVYFCMPLIEGAVT
jgi:adenine/guanine/hypoxanthine permease